MYVWVCVCEWGEVVVVVGGVSLKRPLPVFDSHSVSLRISKNCLLNLHLS